VSGFCSAPLNGERANGPGDVNKASDILAAVG